MRRSSSGFIVLLATLSAACAFTALFMLLNPRTELGRVILVSVLLIGCAIGGLFAHYEMKHAALANAKRVERLCSVSIAVSLACIGVVALLPDVESRPDSSLDWLLPKKARLQKEDRRLREAMRAEHERQRSEDFAWMRAHGQTGRPGEVPPNLSVVDHGLTVEIHNRSDRPIDIALARVLVDPTAPGGYRGCPMHDARHREYYGMIIMQGSQRLTFRLARYCAAEYAQAPIEYRLGLASFAQRSDFVWWSESAFAAPEGWGRVPEVSDSSGTSTQ